MSDVTHILSQIESGDPSAADQLLPLVYDELRKLAAAKLAHEKPGQTLQATALVHDAYLRLVDVEEGATISHNSWIFWGFDQVMYDAIADAATHDHLFVAAAGGQASDNEVLMTFPASYDLDNIISVTASDDTDMLAYFPDDWGGNWGLTTVDVSAPSPEIPATVIGNDYGLFGRVSYATPHVTGVAALLRSLHPDWTAAQIKSQILSTVDPLPSLTGKTVSGGRVNAAAALGVASIEDLLFSNSFENGKWVEDSQNDWFTSTQRAKDGAYSAEVDGRATNATLTMAQPVDMTPYGSAELTFDWYIESGFDSGEYLALDFSPDGSNMLL